MTKTKRFVLITAIVTVAAFALTSCAAVLPHTAQNNGRGQLNAGQGSLYSGQHLGQGQGSGQGLGQGQGMGQGIGNQPQAPAAAAPNAEAPVDLPQDTTYGSAAALSDSTLELADMLAYALQDEYAARAEYDYVLKTFGNVRPFSNIINAEATHIAELAPLFTAYKVSMPADTGSEHVAKAGSFTEALAIGVKAEKDNIAMYEAFLKQPVPADVKAVFEELLKGSQNHLAAFSRSHGK